MPERKESDLRVLFIKSYAQTLRFLVQAWAELRQHPDITKESIRQHLAFKYYHQQLKHIYLSASALDYNDLAHFLQQMNQRLDKTIDEQLITDIDLLMNQLISHAQSPQDPMLVATPSSPDMLPYQQVEQLSSELEKDVLNEILEDIGIVFDHVIIIAIIDDDKAVSYAMQKLLESFSFRVQVFNSIEEFIERDKDHFSHITPHLILLDIVMPNVTEAQVFEFAATMRDQTIKVICLSGLSSYQTRLRAVRAGVDDYIVKPVNVSNLVSKIRKTFHLDTHRPMYIMMLDDQPDICEFYENAVTTPFLSVKAFSNVATFFKVLDNFTPDIFLLDLSMPKISGLEVAKILRQQSKYDFIPIVFLTADETESTKIEILNAGADDVILKGTPVRMVLQHITTRTIRGQHIRYLTSRDSLTGVLNHGQIMDACANAFSLFNRNKTNFVLVLIDLDNFKRVNDDFGHPIGDKVLFGIGQLLHRSLRQSDLVGRYGGEEFVLLLHDTQTEAIEDKVDEIRLTFSELEFKSENNKFHVTLSAGIADAKDYQSLAQLISAADNALYEAKKSGRNRIINANDLNFEPDTNLI